MLKIGIYDLWHSLQNRTFGFFDIFIFRHFIWDESSNLANFGHFLRYFSCMYFLHDVPDFLGFIQPRVLKIGIYDLWHSLQNRTFGFFYIFIFRHFMAVQSSKFGIFGQFWPFLANFRDFLALASSVWLKKWKFQKIQKYDFVRSPRDHIYQFSALQVQ